MRTLGTILPWIWPGGIVVGLGLALTTWWPDLPWLTTAVSQYGWVVLVAAGLLGLRFRRSRVVALAGFLGLLLFLQPAAGVEGAVGPWEAAGAFGIAVVGLLSLLRDRPVLSPMGAFHLLLVVGGGWAALVSAELRPAAWDWLTAFRLGPLGPSAAPVLPAVWAGAMVPLLFQALRLEHPVERGLVWTSAALLLAFQAPAGSLAAQLHLMAAGLVLLLSLVETSYALAYRDELTGLPTRRALSQYFDGIGSRYTVAMVDVDHFKSFNDKHGHDVGDQVLKMVATQLARVTGGGAAFRYGGEEFTVVFPGKTRDEAMDHLEDLRSRIEAARFTVRRFGRPKNKPEEGKKKKPRSPRRLSVTVSIGVAERLDSLRDPEAVLKAADKALYRAKKKGRNRVSR